MAGNPLNNGGIGGGRSNNPLGGGNPLGGSGRGGNTLGGGSPLGGSGRGSGNPLGGNGANPFGNNQGTGSPLGGGLGNTGRGAAGNGRGGRGQAPARGGSQVLDMPLLIFSLIFGAIGGFIGLKVYALTVEALYRPLVVMLAIGAFYIVFALAVYIFQHIRGVYAYKASLADTLIPLLIFTAAILVASFVFEFIYELGGSFKNQDATSYIFIIDDSGSMDVNDSNFARYSAIETILKDQPDSFPYTVYSFSDVAVCTRPMAPKSDGIDVDGLISQHVDMGGTMMLTALDTVAADLDGMNGAGDAPKVLFLSDGYASDISVFTNIKKTLRAYTDKGISISTVGLGSSVDEKLLNSIAKKTGGVYMNVADVGNIANVMTEAIESYSTRDLLSLRSAVRMDWLYVIERILFMALIGAAVGMSMIFTMGITSQDLTMIASIAKGILGGILLEVLINGVGMGERTIDMLYFILIALIISKTAQGQRGRGVDGGGYNDGGSGSGGMGVGKGLGENQKKKTFEGPKSLY